MSTFIEENDKYIKFSELAQNEITSANPGMFINKIYHTIEEKSIIYQGNTTSINVPTLNIENTGPALMSDGSVPLIGPLVVGGAASNFVNSTGKFIFSTGTSANVTTGLTLAPNTTSLVLAAGPKTSTNTIVFKPGSSPYVAINGNYVPYAFSTTGSGNAITSITKSKTSSTLTFNKNETFQIFGSEAKVGNIEITDLNNGLRLSYFSPTTYSQIDLNFANGGSSASKPTISLKDENEVITYIPTNFEFTGTGNAISNVTIQGSTMTFRKDNNFYVNGNNLNIQKFSLYGYGDSHEQQLNIGNSYFSGYFGIEFLGQTSIVTPKIYVHDGVENKKYIPTEFELTGVGNNIGSISMTGDKVVFNRNSYCFDNIEVTGSGNTIVGVTGTANKITFTKNYAFSNVQKAGTGNVVSGLVSEKNNLNAYYTNVPTEFELTGNGNIISSISMTGNKAVFNKTSYCFDNITFTGSGNAIVDAASVSGSGQIKFTKNYMFSNVQNTGTGNVVSGLVGDKNNLTAYRTSVPTEFELTGNGNIISSISMTGNKAVFNKTSYCFDNIEVVGSGNAIIDVTSTPSQIKFTKGNIEQTVEFPSYIKIGNTRIESRNGNTGGFFAYVPDNLQLGSIDVTFDSGNDECPKFTIKSSVNSAITNVRVLKTHFGVTGTGNVLSSNITNNAQSDELIFNKTTCFDEFIKDGTGNVVKDISINGSIISAYMENLDAIKLANYTTDTYAYLLGSSYYDSNFMSNVSLGSQNTTNAPYMRNGSVYYSSDINLKENIKPIDDSFVDELFTYTDLIYDYDWKTTKKHSSGFIAQYIEGMIPEAISGKEGEKHVDYNVALSKVVGAMFKKIKELEYKIECLEQKNRES